MKSLIRFLLVFCLLIAAALPLAAQEPAEFDPAVFDIPEGWKVTAAAEFNDFYGEVPNLEAIVANSGDLWVLLMTPEQIDALLDDETPEDPVDALIAVYDALYDYHIDSDEIDIERIEGFTVTGWHSVDDQSSEGEAHLVRVRDGGFYLVDAYGPSGAIDRYRSEADGMLIGVAAYARAVKAELDDGAELFVPEDWDAIPVDDYNDFYAGIPNLEATALLSDDVTVLVLTPEQVEMLFDGEDVPEDADELMFEAYDRIYNFAIFKDGIKDLNFGGVEARAYSYSYGDHGNRYGEGESYVFPSGEGWYFVDVYGYEGEIEKVTTDLDTILESVAGLAAAR